MKLLVLIILSLLFTLQQAQDTVDETSSCEPITARFCQGMSYNTTLYPRGVRGINLDNIAKIVETGCSSDVATLMCRVVMPECPKEGESEKKPCRALCEEVKKDCLPTIKQQKLTWPAKLQCFNLLNSNCYSSEVKMCESITIPMCQGLFYHQTITPNLLGHKTQREAESHMSSFDSLVKTSCSVDTQFFICSVYAPKCVEGEVQQPCRSLCERAKKDCEGFMTTSGVSWPKELQCESFPTERCLDNIRPEMLNAEGVLAKLNNGGYSVHGKSLSLETARLLLTLMDKDKSGYLEIVEFFKLELFVDPIRKEYLESYESSIPPSVNEAQMKKSLSARGFVLDDENFRALWNTYQSKGGIDFDKFVAVLTKLQILKDRFNEHLTNLPCDSQNAKFSLEQFIKSTII